MTKITPIFLTAAWRHLIMLNFEVDPGLLKPYIPKGTELDYWQDKTYLSIIGLVFYNTRIKGLAIPFHQTFEELNLRFYVRRPGPEGINRGVVFIKELVRKPAIALMARVFYNEEYVAMPMRYTLDGNGKQQKVTYHWKINGRWNLLQATAQEIMRDMSPGSLDEFIAEHYWGYSTQRDGSTVAYQVEHPRWQIRDVSAYQYDCDVAPLYGQQFVTTLTSEPASIFIAEGSDVIIRNGVRLA